MKRSRSPHGGIAGDGKTLPDIRPLFFSPVSAMLLSVHSAMRLKTKIVGHPAACTYLS